MRVFSLVFLLFALCFGTADAQQARSKQYKAPLAGSAALKDADDKYNATVDNLEAPDVEHNADKKKLGDIKKDVTAKYPRQKKNTAQKKTTLVPPPTVSIAFVADSLSGIPPDNYCAVSNGNKGVTVMNSNIAVHDAATGAYIYRKSLYAYSLAVGLVNTGPAGVNYRFDPKIVYDPVADKFISVMLNGTDGNNWIVFGFSQTNDPAGTWNFYKLYGDYEADTTWFDYPAITITQNEFFLTGNKIKYGTSWQAGFRQTLIYQINKNDGYTGAAALNYRIWDSIAYNGRNLRCLYPVKPGDGLGGPEQYFLSNRNFDVTNDSLFLVKVPNVIGDPDSVLTVTPLVSSLHYGVPPNALQPDTSKDLATNDGRVLGGFIRGSEMQFVSTSSNPANGNAAIYHGIISNLTTTPTVTGKLISIDTLDFGYPNISYTANAGGINQSIITYEYSGPNKFPGYGAVFFDGTDYSDMLEIKNGTGSISLLSGKEQRWGDYSPSHPDWNAMGAVWCEGIFGRTDHRYGNYMARLASPYYVDAVPNNTPKTEPAKVFPVPAWEYVNFEFTVATAQVFSFIVYDVSGKVVDKVTDTYCKKGRNNIQFNVSPLPTGNYFLKAIGADGEVVPVHKIIRQ